MTMSYGPSYRTLLMFGGMVVYTILGVTLGTVIGFFIGTNIEPKVISLENRATVIDIGKLVYRVAARFWLPSRLLKDGGRFDFKI